ncbi:hypothetical protein L9F63_027643, partial [Diploptera punctata]
RSSNSIGSKGDGGYLYQNILSECGGKTRYTSNTDNNGRLLRVDWLFENDQQLYPAALNNRNSTINDGGLHICDTCGRNYTWKTSLRRHMRDECGKEPRFPCPYCPHKSKRRGRLFHHISRMHPS